MQTEQIQLDLLEPSIEKQCSEAISNFHKILSFYTLFHSTFFLLVIFGILSFLVFFSFLAKSYLMAMSLAILFLTVFSYFVILYYFQAKKSEQFLEVQTEFIAACEKQNPYEKGQPEYHLSIAKAIRNFTDQIDGCEYRFFKQGGNSGTITILLQKLSAWLHWKDVHKMKELLSSVAIDQHIQLVRVEPTDLEAHASLAEAYLTLSKLYIDPRKKNSQFSYSWVPNDYESEKMKDKFRFAALRAIEEFKILDSYVPNDPWVHAQLACIYHDLEMREEEIGQYEKMSKISPNDRHVLFRLGALYFRTGENAKGLHIYQMLKNAKDEMANELISHYGTYTPTR